MLRKMLKNYRSPGPKDDGKAEAPTPPMSASPQQPLHEETEGVVSPAPQQPHENETSNLNLETPSSQQTAGESNPFMESIDHYLLSNNGNNEPQLSHDVIPLEEQHDDNEEDYVPESLASFVQQANSMLEQTQQNFLDEMQQPDDVVVPAQSWETAPPPLPAEDANDRELKGQIMNRLQHHQDLWSPDVFTSPPPVNPAANLTYSQIIKTRDETVVSTPSSPVQPMATTNEQNSTTMEQQTHQNIENTPHEENPGTALFNIIVSEEPEMEVNFDTPPTAPPTKDLLGNQTQQQQQQTITIHGEANPVDLLDTQNTGPQFFNSTEALPGTDLVNLLSQQEEEVILQHIGDVDETVDSPPAAENPIMFSTSTLSTLTKDSRESPEARTPASLERTALTEPSPVEPSATKTLLKTSPPANLPVERKNVQHSNKTPPKPEQQTPVVSAPRTAPSVAKTATPPSSSRSRLSSSNARVGGRLSTSASKATPRTRTNNSRSSTSKATPAQSERQDELYNRLASKSTTIQARRQEMARAKTSPKTPVVGATTTVTSSRTRATPSSIQVASRLMQGTSASKSHSSQRPKPGTRTTPESTPPPLPKKRSSPVASRLMEGTSASRAHAAQRPSPPQTRSTTTSPPKPSPPRRRTSPNHAASRLMESTAASRAHVPSSSPGKTTPPSGRLTEETAASRAHHAESTKQKKQRPPLPTSSRLVQPTEASRAHTRPPLEDISARSAESSVQRTTSRLLQGTAASERRRKTQSDTNVNTRSAATDARWTKGTSQVRGTSDGSAKAQERVRQHRLKLKQQHQQPTQVTASKPTTRLTSDERIARARERVKQRELQLAEEKKKGMAASKKRLTVPHAPKFATTAKYGERQGTVARAGPTLAQSDAILRKGLRDDKDVSLVRRRAAGRPTVPKSPAFATSARCGDKAFGAGYGKRELTSAQSTNILRTQLRQPITVSRKREPGLTVPKTPQFHASAKRAMPKSTAEKEKELMEYFKAHPFKANPVNTQLRSSQSVRRPSKRRLTMPAPFSLQTDARGAHAKPVEASPDPEEKDLEEMKKQFHARPMPKFSQPSKTSARSTSKSRHLTQPQPFHFASERVSRSERRHVVEAPDEVEMSKQFRARPPPRSTYEYTAPMVHNSPASSLSSDMQIKPFSLHTAERSGKRRESSEVAHRKADEFAQRKKVEFQRRLRERHIDAMRQAEVASPISVSSKNASPFSLQSVARHEEYQKKFEQQRREEEARRREEMEFHARSFTSPPAPEKVRSERGPTNPQPFAMPGMHRHEMSQEAQKRKLAAMEEERRAMAGFKARPLPRTTYEFKKISPHGTGELVDPFSPQLQSKHRATERRAFDEQAEKHRREEEERQQQIQAQFEAENEADLQERRRLPVSEGGMIPTAEPVNAVFFELV